jgi:hypothetical protein
MFPHKVSFSRIKTRSVYSMLEKNGNQRFPSTLHVSFRAEIWSGVGLPRARLASWPAAFFWEYRRRGGIRATAMVENETGYQAGWGRLRVGMEGWIEV